MSSQEITARAVLQPQIDSALPKNPAVQDTAHRVSVEPSQSRIVTMCHHKMVKPIQATDIQRMDKSWAVKPSQAIKKGPIDAQRVCDARVV